MGSGKGATELFVVRIGFFQDGGGGIGIQKLHGDEGLAALFVDFVDRADVEMVQRRCGLGFALKPAQRRVRSRRLRGAEIFRAAKRWSLIDSACGPHPSRRRRELP
jgi:hypothetical protein